MLDDFLAFARPPELNAAPHDVVAIVQRVAELEKVAAERKGAALQVSAPAVATIANVDAPKLQQVLHNLVRNAIDAVSTGGVVAMSVAATDTGVRIRVADGQFPGVHWLPSPWPSRTHGPWLP